MCIYTYIYIYIYIMCTRYTANLPTDNVDFRGFDSSIMLYFRGGIPRPIGDFPESLSLAMLVGVMLVGSLGVIPPYTQRNSRQTISPTPTRLSKKSFTGEGSETKTGTCTRQGSVQSHVRLMSWSWRPLAACPFPKVERRFV